MTMNYCPQCGKEYAPHSAMCPPCNYWFRAPAAFETVVADSGFNKKQIAAFAGTVLLLIGLFTPLVGLPFFTFNYYNLSQFSSLAGLGFFLLLLCGVGGIILAVTKRYTALKWPGIAALLIIVGTFSIIQSKLSAARAAMAEDMNSMPNAASNPFKGMGDAFMGMIQMQWGWGVLLAGAALMIVASLLKDE